MKQTDGAADWMAEVAEQIEKQGGIEMYRPALEDLRRHAAALRQIRCDGCRWYDRSPMEDGTNIAGRCLLLSTDTDGWPEPDPDLDCGEDAKATAIGDCGYGAQLFVAPEFGCAEWAAPE